ncbi:carbohydrate ABC transporter permease [Streptococcus hyointestinalis]|uniref:carbohydrate ABC transporter permease n=1 Tax=Streptococcus hyointestinalis TaxID=1337 RepID=UPI0013DF5255|nr:carbohydrate ABC transporter permease [Streptococcus hyointestinalis]
MKMTTMQRCMNYSVILLMTLVVMTPLVVGIYTSLLPTEDLIQGNIFTSNLSLDNYISAIRDTPIIRYFLNSLLISTLTMVGSVAVSALCAYPFAFMEFKGKKLVFALILATMMIPFEAIVIPNFITVKSMNLLNSYAGLIIPFLASGFGIFMLRQAFLQIPSDLYEEAQIEGLSHLQFFLKVVLPYSKVNIVVLASYTFLGSWNQYFWPMLATFTDTVRPVQIGLRQLQSTETFNDWGMIQASAVIIIIPTLLVLFLGQRHAKINNEGAVK